MGDALHFFTFAGRICWTVTGVVASLELHSSKTGVEGCPDSTARYWHTASAAAYMKLYIYKLYLTQSNIDDNTSIYPMADLDTNPMAYLKITIKMLGRKEPKLEIIWFVVAKSGLPNATKSLWMQHKFFKYANNYTEQYSKHFKYLLFLCAIQVCYQQSILLESILLLSLIKILNQYP